MSDQQSEKRPGDDYMRTAAANAATTTHSGERAIAHSILALRETLIDRLPRGVAEPEKGLADQIEEAQKQPGLSELFRLAGRATLQADLASETRSRVAHLEDELSEAEAARDDAYRRVEHLEREVERLRDARPANLTALIEELERQTRAADVRVDGTDQPAKTWHGGQAVAYDAAARLARQHNPDSNPELEALREKVRGLADEWEKLSTEEGHTAGYWIAAVDASADLRRLLDPATAEEADDAE